MLSVSTILAIATLCQLSGGYGMHAQQAMLTCQQYYISCLQKKDGIVEITLPKCIKERKL